MATSNFYPWAIGVGANVLAPTAFGALSVRNAGFQSGITLSSNLNTVLRQTASWSALLGAFTAQYSGLDANDDGDLQTLQDRFEAALREAVGYNIVRYGEDLGTADQIVLTLTPAVTTLVPGATFIVRMGASNTGPTTLSVNAITPVDVVRPDGSDLSGDDLLVGGVYIFTYDSIDEVFKLVGGVGTDGGTPPSQNSLWHYGVDAGSANALEVTTSPTVGSLSSGLTCLVKVANNNTGATTINVGGLGVKNVKHVDGSALSSGDIKAGGLYIFGYDGTQFQLLGMASAGGGGGGGDLPDNWNDISAPLRPYWITVISATTTAPPVSPVAGDTYLVPAGASGAWVGFTDKVAQYNDTLGWVYANYPIASVIGVSDTGKWLRRTSGGWREFFASILEHTTGTATDLWCHPAGVKAMIQAFFPANAQGALTNNGSGVLSWVAYPVFPANAQGFLRNDGVGNLTWATPPLDIHGLTTKSSPSDSDEVPIYDIAGVGNKKMTIAAIRALIGSNLTDEQLSDMFFLGMM